MTRRYMDGEAEANAQEPVLLALEGYFDTAYEPGSDFGSVSTIGSTSNEQILILTAFRVDRKYMETVLAFMAAHGEKLAAIVEAPSDDENG